MKNQREKIAKALLKYLPEVHIAYVVELLFAEKLIFRVSKPRKTKLGDYRPPFNGKPHRISINSDLNPYAFLITTLHELAHLQTHKKYGMGVKSHGEEWKKEFKLLLLPILDKKELPSEIEMALKRSLNNLKASSCTDIHLSRALRKYDRKDDSLKLLEEIGNDSYFQIGEKMFQRGILRRRRYLCKEVNTGRYYLVSRLAEVEPLKQEQIE